MPEVTRRRLLGIAAASAGGVPAASLLPPNLRKALAAGPQRGSLRDVEHVVIHMQENRSFDHYFGTLAGVRGFGDPNVLIQSNDLPTNGKPVFFQYDPDNTAGGSYLLPWHLDTQTTSSQAIPSTSHAWTVQHSAVDIVTQSGKNVSLNDNWLPAHLTADEPRMGRTR
jgi:phospholipase C